jgi:hypothetical protein
MRRRLPIYKVWREYKPSGGELPRGTPSPYSYTIIEAIPETNNPEHHIFKRYISYCFTELF